MKDAKDANTDKAAALGKVGTLRGRGMNRERWGHVVVGLGYILLIGPTALSPLLSTPPATAGVGLFLMLAGLILIIAGPPTA